jgi:hypothetical protein
VSSKPTALLPVPKKAGAPSTVQQGDRSWGQKHTITVKRESVFSKWVYDESDSERCECLPGEAGEKESGFVHNAVKCEYAIFQYCYICQDDEVDLK